MLRRPNRHLAALIASCAILACVAGCQLHVLENGLWGKPRASEPMGPPDSLQMPAGPRDDVSLRPPVSPVVNPWFTGEQWTAIIGGLIAAGYGVMNHFSRARVAKQVKGKG